MTIHKKMFLIGAIVALIGISFISLKTYLQTQAISVITPCAIEDYGSTGNVDVWKDGCIKYNCCSDSLTCSTTLLTDSNGACTNWILDGADKEACADVIYNHKNVCPNLIPFSSSQGCIPGLKCLTNDECFDGKCENVTPPTCEYAVNLEQNSSLTCESIIKMNPCANIYGIGTTTGCISISDPYSIKVFCTGDNVTDVFCSLFQENLVDALFTLSKPSECNFVLSPDVSCSQLDNSGICDTLWGPTTQQTCKEDVVNGVTNLFCVGDNVGENKCTTLPAKITDTIFYDAKAGSCTCPGVDVCGDGQITGSEECDIKANPTGCKDGYDCIECQCVEAPTPSCSNYNLVALCKGLSDISCENSYVEALPNDFRICDLIYDLTGGTSCVMGKQACEMPVCEEGAICHINDECYGGICEGEEDYMCNYTLIEGITCDNPLLIDACVKIYGSEVVQSCSDDTLPGDKLGALLNCIGPDVYVNARRCKVIDTYVVDAQLIKGIAGSCTKCPSVCTDNDGDGYYAQDNCGTLVDCDDNNPKIHPNILDSECDNIDNNCNGLIDEDYIPYTCGIEFCESLSICEEGQTSCTPLDPVAFYPDSDGDGFGIKNEPILTCEPITGYVSNADDCDDKDANIYPGAPDVCNEYGVIVDMGCGDGYDDLNCNEYCKDNDSDGYTVDKMPEDWDGKYSPTCPWVIGNGDCNDKNANIYPGAPDVWGDGIDSNCDNIVCGVYNKQYIKDVTCSETPIVVSNDAELATYLKDYGYNGVTYSGLIINYHVNQTNIDIHSPCNISVVKGVSFIGDTVCMDGRLGVKNIIGGTPEPWQGTPVYWPEPKASTPEPWQGTPEPWQGMPIYAQQVAILSQFGNAYVGDGSMIYANEMAIGAGKRAYIGSNSIVNINGFLRIFSIGNLPISDAGIGAKAIVNAKNLTIMSTRESYIGATTVVNIADTLKLHSVIKDGGTSPQSLAQIEHNAIVTVGKKISISSSNKANLGQKTLLTTNEFYMSAASPDLCSIRTKAVYDANILSGNCLLTPKQ